VPYACGASGHGAEMEADLAFLRTYDLDTLEDVGSTGLPDWIGPWVQEPYKERFGPRCLRWDDLPVTVDGRDAMLCRWGVVYPHLQILDLIVVVRDVPLDELPQSASLGVQFLSDRWKHDPRLDVSPANSLQWLCDMTYADLTGTRVRTLHPRRTSFGLLVFPTSDVCPDRQTVEGLQSHHRLHVQAYHHVVFGLDERSLFGLGPYVVLAGLVSRGRHLMKRVKDEIDETTTRVLDRSMRTDHAVQRAAEVQAAAIRLHSEMAGWGYLNNDRMKRVFDAIDRTGGVPERDRTNLNTSLEGLDRLTNSLQALAADGFQRRVSVFGLYFGLFSVFLASVGIVSLVSEETSTRDRLWVFVTVVALGAWFGILGHRSKRYVRR
jgi:hypothetical protein